MNNFKLNNNKNIPSIAFGTWKLKPNDETTEIIKQAIKCGYRHFDTASAYGNELYIGKAIKEIDIDRKDLFITGKLWNDDRGFENIVDACQKTIANLQCDYLDLYLIHWPASKALYNDWKEINKQTWKAFEYLYNQGLVKAIGVCNFKKHHLESLLESANIMPMVNQIEFHPGFMQEETVKFCQENNIIVEAWSPLGSGKMLKNEQLINLAKKYNVSTARLIIKWCLQNNVLPIPKSKNEERMKENLEIDNFKITNLDMDEINNMEYFGGSGLDSDTLTLFK